MKVTTLQVVTCQVASRVATHTICSQGVWSITTLLVRLAQRGKETGAHSMVTDQIWEAACSVPSQGEPLLIWKLVRFKAKQVAPGGEGRGEEREPIWARLHVEIAPH